MQLVRLLYFSRNRLAHCGGSIDEGLAGLIAACAAQNRRDRISGLLVHDEKWFVQAIEGDATVVSRTFERILRDRRHSDVTLIEMQPVAARRYGSAPMGGIARDADNAGIFVHYAEGPRFEPQLMPADRLGDLVEALLRDAAKCPTKSRSAFRGMPWTTGNVTNAA